jgi:ABC-type phosphate/phosphonate transport system permease subunit
MFMSLPLPYYPLLAQWIPGFITLLFFAFPFGRQYVDNSTSSGIIAIYIFLFSVIAFVIGQIIDAIRNSILEEYIFDHGCVKIDWISFSMIQNEKLDNLYFVYYAFDINLVISLIIGIVVIFLPYYGFMACSSKERWSGFLGQGTGIYKWEVALC